MQFIEQLNTYIETPHPIDEVRGRRSFYPSEASIISRTDGRIIGRCHRAIWYDWTGVKPSNPTDARGWWTFQVGNLIESAYIENAKQLGIWAGDHIKFYNQELNIAGEADLFIFREPLHKDLPKTIAGVEIKSAYGYGFQRSIKEQPKIENLLQVALYLNHFENIDEWLLVYHSRDTMENVEYKITINKDDVGKYLVIDETMPVRVFYIKDIHDRFRTLGGYLMKGELPPRDYTYGYSINQTLERLEKGIITKSKYNAIKAGKAIDSDWN